LNASLNLKESFKTNILYSTSHAKHINSGTYCC